MPSRWSADRRSPTCTCASADRKFSSRRLRQLGILLALSLLASCASLPAARLAESPWASLPSDGDLYLYADARQARGLLGPLAAGFLTPRGGKAGRVEPLLDRSEEVYACLNLPVPGAAEPGSSGGAGGAELAVTGRWSPNLLSARLDWSCGWKRHQPSPASPPYWSERRTGLEVGSPAPGLLLAALGEPGAVERMASRREAGRLSPQAGPVELAREQDPRVGPLLAGAVLYVFLPAAAKRAGEQEATPAGGSLPFRALWLTAHRRQDQYELGALAALAGTPNKRALIGLVRLAAAGWLRKAGIPEVAARLRAMDIEVEEGGLSVRGLRLTEPEMRALLQSVLPPTGGSDARGGD